MMKGLNNVGGKGSPRQVYVGHVVRTTLPQKKGAGVTKEAKAGLMRNDTGTQKK